MDFQLESSAQILDFSWKHISVVTIEGTDPFIKTYCVGKWLTDWLTDWLIDQLTDRQTDRLNERIYELINQLMRRCVSFVHIYSIGQTVTREHPEDGEMNQAQDSKLDIGSNVKQ